MTDAEVRRTIRTLATAALASGMSMRICDPMLPRLAEEFGGASTDLAIVVTAFAIAYGPFSLVHGPLGDRRGKLLVIRWASLVAAVASVACGLAPSRTALVLARFVVGGACAALIPLSLAWIGDRVDYARRQPVLARFAAASISGLIAGQVLGGVLTDTAGWRTAFIVPAAMFVVAGVLIGREVRRERTAAMVPSGESAGPPGTAPGMSPGGRARSTGADAPPGGALAAYRRLLGNPWARFLILAAMIEGGACFGAIAFVPSFLHERHGVSLWTAGLVVAAFGVGGLVYSALARRLVQGLGEVRLSRLGGALLAAGYLGIALAPDWRLSVLGSLLTGAGLYMLHNGLQTQATQMDPAARGSAIAIFALFLFLGQSAGVALASRAIPLIGYAGTFATSAVVLAVLGLVVGARFARLSTRDR